jgi:hypothetical protein
MRRRPAAPFAGCAALPCFTLYIFSSARCSKRFGILAIARIDRLADRRAQMLLLTLDPIRQCHALGHRLGDPRQTAHVRQAGQHHHELIATVAAHDIAGANPG